MTPYALDLVERLDALIREARRVPVIRRDRVDAEAAYEILDELRAELGEAPSDVLTVVDAIDDVLFDARPLPFRADEVVDRERLLALVAELRSRLTEAAERTWSEPPAPSE